MDWENFGQLGGIFGELENPKSKPALEIGLWNIDGFEKVGTREKNDPITNVPQDPPRVVKRWDDDADAIFNHHVQNHGSYFRKNKYSNLLPMLPHPCQLAFFFK